MIAEQLYSTLLKLFWHFLIKSVARWLLRALGCAFPWRRWAPGVYRRMPASFEGHCQTLMYEWATRATTARLRDVCTLRSTAKLAYYLSGVCTCVRTRGCLLPGE